MVHFTDMFLFSLCGKLFGLHPGHFEYNPSSLLLFVLGKRNPLSTHILALVQLTRFLETEPFGFCSFNHKQSGFFCI